MPGLLSEEEYSIIIKRMQQKSFSAAETEVSEKIFDLKQEGLQKESERAALSSVNYQAYREKRILGSSPLSLPASIDCSKIPSKRRNNVVKTFGGGSLLSENHFKEMMEKSSSDAEQRQLTQEKFKKLHKLAVETPLQLQRESGDQEMLMVKNRGMSNKVKTVGTTIFKFDGNGVAKVPKTENANYQLLLRQPGYSSYLGESAVPELVQTAVEEKDTFTLTGTVEPLLPFETEESSDDEEDENNDDDGGEDPSDVVEEDSLDTVNEEDLLDASNEEESSDDTVEEVVVPKKKKSKKRKSWEES